MASEAEEAQVQEEEAAAQQKTEEEEATAEESEEEESEEVSSSMVASWSYSPSAEEIMVVFVNGHEESYACSADQWASAKSAASPGKYMWEVFL